MTLPPAADLLDVWEWGLGRLPGERALALLAAAERQPREALLRLALGARDARLLALRRALFGDDLTATVDCPACGELLEVALAGEALMPVEVSAQDSANAEPLVLRQDGWTVRFRLPMAADLAAIEPLAAAGAEAQPEVEAVRQALLERCVEEVRYDDDAGCDLDATRLPLAVQQAIGERMDAEDPGADIALALACAACDHAWLGRLDVVAYLWREIDAWARRTLRDVHTLAARCGWSEGEILAMSPRRRALYLELGSA